MLEDFADLDLSDEDTSHSREGRMRAAFEKSKQSYAKELVMTEPGVQNHPIQSITQLMLPRV